MGDAAPPAAAAASSSSDFSYLAALGNCPLVAAVLAFAIAQSIKVFTTWYASLACLGVCYQEGFGSSLFATAAIFASVVMYDAFGVRLHAGKQAEDTTDASTSQTSVTSIDSFRDDLASTIAHSE